VKDKNVEVAKAILHQINIYGLDKMFDSRVAIGFNKYGVTTEREDLTLEQWKLHALEEAMDHLIYCVKIAELSEFSKPSIALRAASVDTLVLTMGLYFGEENNDK
jgi:hypothetical protein